MNYFLAQKISITSYSQVEVGDKYIEGHLAKYKCAFKDDDLQ